MGADGTVVGAVPHLLAAYATAMVPLEGALARRGAEVGDLASTTGDLAPTTAALGARTRGVATRATATARRAAEVGAALLAADGTPRPWARCPTTDPAKLAVELAVAHPDAVGSSGLVPLAARYAANRERARRASAAAHAAGDHRRAERFGGFAAPDRRLLVFDPAGDGRVVEVLGADPATADHVAVLVPGMLSTLANHDRELRPKAEAVLAEARAAAPDDDVTVVAWLGYDAPGVLDAPLDDDALRGAPALVAAVDELRAAGAADVTVVGHSYGSVVVGAALRAGLDADRVVVTGSPGMLADHVDELGPTPVYALRAPLDVVSLSEGLGRDPSDPRFGATRLVADVPGHSGYAVPGSAGAAAVAAAVTATLTAAHVDRPSPFEVAAGMADDVLERTNNGRDQALDGVGDLAGELEQVLLDRLPGPAGELFEQAASSASTAAEYGRRALDLADRLVSPDLWTDVALDLGDVVGTVLDREPPARRVVPIPVG